ncbi:MAG: terpene cyclase/mutase family protein [Acidobacteria bacterium]|nr:terpene cyclase/mutase family protein [Acidobacteriota bacterium]
MFPPLHRRMFLGSLAAAPLAARDSSLANFVETLAKPGGGYSWLPESDAHLTPTFGAVACYHVLGEPCPGRAATARFLRERYPMPERRRNDRPLRRFNYEQIQGLLWLNEDVTSFREEVLSWTQPSIFTTQYEHGGYPVFQHEMMAILCRQLLGLPVATPQWKAYVTERRRANGSFNNTPARAGGDGHVMNTWWGLLALTALGEPLGSNPDLIRWLRSCQTGSGGFTWQPKPQLAPIDDVSYTWAAVLALDALGSAPERPSAAIAYLQSARNADGGWGDRPGRASNLTASARALEALGKLRTAPATSSRRLSAPRRLPEGLHAFTAQVEAPGAGSPSEAVELARVLRIHLWGAKNAQKGWVEECQRVADSHKVPVTFFVANEEYGNYVSVPGLGTYSHLSDITAPAKVDFGAPMIDPKNPVPWSHFRDTRIAAIRAARGGMIWQFNENEELTRILLDEAVERGTYAAIAAAHFGNENFLNTQPFLMRYHGLLPYVALQDAHAQESWWWADQLAGFRTVFLAKAPTWDGWLEALREQRTVSIRHDAVNRFITHWDGGDAAVRRAIAAAEADWRWWGVQPNQILRPAASLVAVTPTSLFEEARPSEGVALRLRLRHRNTTQGGPAEPEAQLVELTVDGKQVEPRLVEKTNNRKQLSDRYYRFDRANLTGRHTAAARVKLLSTGQEERFEIAFS